MRSSLHTGVYVIGAILAFTMLWYLSIRSSNSHPASAYSSGYSNTASWAVATQQRIDQINDRIAVLERRMLTVHTVEFQLQDGSTLRVAVDWRLYDTLRQGTTITHDKTIGNKLLDVPPGGKVVIRQLVRTSPSGVELP